MLNREFNDWSTNPDLDLNPTDLKEQMDDVDHIVYNHLNNGVYKCGFAQTQQAYDAAITNLTNAFDRVESILQKQRYIAGNRFTLSDVRLFVTLLRFDEVYNVYFKCNTRTVANSPTLLNYVREIYQMDGVKETINMDQIKLHYYASHPELNTFSIVPRGPNFEANLQEKHNRDELFPPQQAGVESTITDTTKPTLEESGWDALLVG
jgi:putative glutathione S-transferase